jgi:PEP-CTERM motif
MSLKHMLRAVSAAALLAAAGAASAAVITLDFEGVGDLNPVGNFYNGGAGTNYGVSFSPDTLAVVDSDSGGSGNFANEPSANTVMFFLNANTAILNYAAGFVDGFSFFYSSSTAATVTVWDGLNGTGNLLGTLTLSAQHTQNCVGDPNGTFCNWSAVGVTFGMGLTARSINFGGTANQTAFDNITFGSATPGSGPTGVPEPASLALVGSALLGLAASRRRKA